MTASPEPVVLELQNSASGPPPWLEFGRVRVGKQKTLVFEVLNSTDEIQEVHLHRITAEKGFHLRPGTDGTHVHAIPPQTKVPLEVNWRPKELGPVRESLFLKWPGSGRLQVVLHGTALGGPQATRGQNGLSRNAAVPPTPCVSGKRKKQTRDADRSSSLAAVGNLLGRKESPWRRETPPRKPLKMQRPNATSPVPGSPPLPAIGPGCEAPGTPPAMRPGYAVPKSPLAPRFAQLVRAGRGAPTPAVPDSASKLSRTGRAVVSRVEAAVAQRKSFSHFHNIAWMERQERAFTVWLNAVLQPTDEVLGEENSLAAKRAAAKVRGLLWRLYSEDDGVVSTMLRLEQRIDSGFMRMKEEQSLLGDVRIREAGLEVLGSYHPFWLKLGLELVTGKPVTLTAKSVKRQVVQLEAFIVDHFLNDAELAYQWALNKAIDGLYSRQFWAELGQMVLKRFLLFALLLDRAVSSPSLPPGTPLLFCKQANIKSSHEAVLIFLRERMFGEGDIMRHLASNGYRLTYEQDPRAEFNFGVTNLALDLRNGMRLCKLIELLSEETGLVAATYLPADRRPQQIQNVESALLAMEEQGCLVTVRADDIVNGIRDKTLELLWLVIRDFQLARLFDLHTLKKEQQLLAAQSQSNSTVNQPAVTPPAAVQQLGDFAIAIFNWASGVVGGFNICLKDFSTAFADGRVFCLLVHAYLPWYISQAAIYGSSQDLLSSADQLKEELGGQLPENLDAAAAERRREGVKRNFTLLAAATSRLGGVPPLLDAEDCFGERGPDEKAVVLFTAYLCARLLEVSEEERAAHAIQRAWRARETRKPGWARAHLHSWIDAARRIQRAWKARQCRNRLVLSRPLRSHLLRRITRVQACWRGKKARLELSRMNAAATVLQATFRGLLGRKLFHDNYLLPPILQHALQRHESMRQARRLRDMTAAAVVLQSCWRRRIQRRKFLASVAATKKIQAGARMYIARAQFVRARLCIVRLQAIWRGKQVRKRVASMHAAALKIQAAWRGNHVRQSLMEQHAAAVQIQAAFRGYSQKARFVQLKMATGILQARWRRVMAQRRIIAMHSAAQRIQAVWKGLQVRIWLQGQQQAAIKIQAAIRGHAQRSRFCRQKRGAIAIQAACRGWAVRKKLSVLNTSATVIQSFWRRALARANFARHSSAAVKIQANFRMHCQKRRYLQIQAAAVRLQAIRRGKISRLYCQKMRAAREIQRIARGHLARLHARRQTSAAVAIQAAWRRHLQRQRFLTMRRAAVCLQTNARRHAAQRKLTKAKAAAVTIQAAARGMLQRATLQRQNVAATRLQKAWRHFEQRAALKDALTRLRLRRCATRIQAHWKGYAVRKQWSRITAAAVFIQATWRRHSARCRYIDTRQAALTFQRIWRGRAGRLLAAHHKKEVSATKIQICWRKYTARQLLRRTQAAIVVQKNFRAWRTQTQLQYWHGAATVIQAAFRMNMCRKRYLKILGRMRAEAEMQRAMREFARAAKAYSRKVAAAIRIQTAARGFLARLEAKRRQAIMLAILEAEEARRRDALAVIAPYARLFADRSHFLAMRRASSVIQRIWKICFAKKTAAAICVQATAKAWLSQRRFKVMQAAAISLQAAWRGYSTRRIAGRQFKGIRLRLARAALTAISHPERRIGYRSTAAVEKLCLAKHFAENSQAVGELARLTSCSPACCHIAATSACIEKLLQVAQTCLRRQTDQKTLQEAYVVLCNLSKYQSPAAILLEDSNLLPILAGHLQALRDNEALFLLITALLANLVRTSGHATIVAQDQASIKQMVAVAQLLSRKIDSEHKYLARLEGQKGSDRSAKEATRKVVAATRQLASLEAVLNVLGARITLGKEDAGGGGNAKCIGKNTIVRDVLSEIGQRTRQQP